MAGFEKEIFLNPDKIDKFICPVCLQIIRDWTIDPCGHSFCNECVISWINANPTCPISKKPLALKNLIKHPGLEAEMKKLAVRCVHLEEGCAWTGLLEDYPSHLEAECDFEGELCPDKCGAVYPAKTRQEHKKVCANRIENCDFCEVKTQFRLMDDHKKACLKRPTECLHCALMVVLAEMEGHLKVCPSLPVVCRFQKFGCVWKDKRSEEEAHVQVYYNEHEQMLLSKIQALSLEQKNLKDQLNNVNKPKEPVKKMSHNKSMVIDTKTEKPNSLKKKQQKAETPKNRPRKT